MKTLLHKTKSLTALFTLITLLILPGVGWGQISITSNGTAFTQNFNTMLGTSATAALTTDQWRAASNSVAATWAAANLTATTQLGGTAVAVSAGGCYNYGDGVANSATDRALGFLSSGTAPWPGTSTTPLNIYAQFQNATGATITQLSGSFDIEKYRNGTNAQGFSMNFFYSLDGSTWTGITSGNHVFGADPNNNAVNPAGSYPKTFSITGLNITNNSNFYLRWAYFVTSGSTATNAQGLGIDNFSITTTGSTPTINVTGSFNAFTTTVGTPSASQSVAVSGTNLTANIDVAALSGYEYSTTDAAPWTTTLSLASSFNGNVYVRLTGASLGTYTGNVSFTSTGATQVDKVVSGIVNPLTPVINVTGTFSAFSTTVGTPSASQSLAVSGSNLTANIDVAALSGYEYSTTDADPWTSTLSLASSFNGNVYVRLTGSILGTYNGNVSFTSTGASQVDIAASGSVTAPPPVITVTGTFTPFTTTVGTPSASQSVAVSGSNLTAGIGVSAVTGYEYSTTDADPWTSTLSLSSSFSGNVYVRLTGASGGTYPGTISFTSTGATQVDKTVSGTVACAPATFPFIENFDYAESALLTSNCWTAHSAGGTNSITVTTSSINYSGYLSSGIGNEVTLSTSGEDINKGFTSTNSGDLYASFIVNVTSAQTNGDYFAHFGATSGSNVTSFGGRIWVKKDATTDNFAFGVSKSSTTANISYTDFNYTTGTTYLVVVKYSIVSGATNDVADLYINPTLNALEPTPTISTLIVDNGTVDPAQLTSFCLRQGNSANAPALKLDGIRVATTWADIVGPASTTWDGSASNDWNNAANWSAGIPTSSMDVIIPFTGITNFPTLSAAGTCKNITIASGATLLDNGFLTVTGTATVEREIAAWGTAVQGWHLVSSPVSNQVLSSSNWITSPATSYDFYAYDETTTTAYWLNQKEETNNITSFVPGKGYLVAYQLEDTKTFSGALNVANVSNIPLSFTAASPNAGWNLLGNPFASGLFWGSWASTNENIGGVAKVLSSTDAQYIDIEGGSIIPAMNGFFVHTTAATTLTIPTTARTHGGTWYKNGESVSKLTLTARDLDGETAQSSNVRIVAEATTGFDRLYDSEFVPFYAPQFYSVNGDLHLSTNAIPSITGETVINFGFIRNGGNNFRIEATGIESIGTTPYLTDKKTNTVTNLSVSPVYSFTAAEGDDVNRFTLHFSTVGIDNPATGEAVQVYAHSGLVYINGAPANAQVTLTDITGRVVQRATTGGSSLSTLSVSSLPHGMYVVTVISGQQSLSRKVVL
jgi:phage gp45-like